MNRVPLEFAAGLAALTGVALLVAVFSTAPKAAKSIKVLVATRTEANSECGDGAQVIRVLPGGVELNGRATTAAGLETELRAAMRNRAERIAYVTGDPNARFAEVAQVLSLVRSLQTQPVMLTPSAGGCLVLPASNAAPGGQQVALRKRIRTAPWWRLW